VKNEKEEKKHYFGAEINLFAGRERRDVSSYLEKVSIVFVSSLLAAAAGICFQVAANNCQKSRLHFTHSF
jgi:hypothetical protein